MGLAPDHGVPKVKGILNRGRQSRRRFQSTCTTQSVESGKAEAVSLANVNWFEISSIPRNLDRADAAAAPNQVSRSNALRFYT